MHCPAEFPTPDDERIFQQAALAQIIPKIPVRDRTGRIIGVAGFSRRVEHLRRNAAVIHKPAAVVNHSHNPFAEEFSTPNLAKSVGLSTSRFERLFRKTFRTSPRQYLQQIRIQHACRLLLETEDTIAAIAQRCGYHGHAHFTKVLASQAGIAPPRFRKSFGRGGAEGSG